MAQSPGGSIGIIWADISLYFYYTPCLFQAVAWFSWSDMWEWQQSQGQKPESLLKAGGMFASLWLACPKQRSVLGSSESPAWSKCYVNIEKCYFYQGYMTEKSSIKHIHILWHGFSFIIFNNSMLFCNHVRSIHIGSTFPLQTIMWFDREGL